MSEPQAEIDFHVCIRAVGILTRILLLIDSFESPYMFMVI